VCFVAYRQHAVGDPGVHGARAVSSDAYDRDTGASPRHGGAPRGSEDWDGSEDLDFDGLLDRDCLGVRGERPASRRELAELLLRYRDEQASRQSRRKKEETARPRFSPEQRLLILDVSCVTLHGPCSAGLLERCHGQGA